MGVNLPPEVIESCHELPRHSNMQTFSSISPSSFFRFSPPSELYIRIFADILSREQSI